MKCRWADCPHEPEYELTVRWSEADFATYEVCWEHRNELAEVLSDQLVDGQPPAEMTYVELDMERPQFA